MTENEFRTMLNEEYPPIVLWGMEFPAGTVLRTLDYIAFREAFNDYLDAMGLDEED